jgi:alkanesulfonate monooxygenase SsuD/methylene tetrahydromethanopterin reductase-like flavin-dependent oxidoreductase (luciferase family)
MKVGVSLFMQNYTDWDRFERIESGAPTSPVAEPDWKIYADELALGRLAEPLGFDSIWTVEHHFTPYTMVPDPISLLSYFAGCTERVEMGTMVVVLPWHDPVRVAEGISTLDNMLGGRRLNIGFGRGLGRREFGGLRVAMEESRDRFAEALDVIRTALANEWWSYDGVYHRVPRTTLRPRPRTDPDVLIDRMYCAWGSPQTIPIAAQTGLRALFIPQTTWEDYAQQMQRFADLRAAAGFEPAHPTVCVWVYCAPTADRAEEGASRYIANYADSARRHYELTSEHFGKTKGYEHYAEGRERIREMGDSYDLAAMYLNNQVWGTPDQCVDKLETIRRMMGPDHFVCVMKYGGMPVDVAEASMRLFAAEVLPAAQQLPDPPAPTASGSTAAARS